MGAPNDLIYIAGVLLVALLGAGLGFTGRIFLAGVREQVVQAVVNTSIDAVLGTIKTGVQDLKDDMKLVKTSQESQRQSSLLTNSDLSAMRTRMEDHLTADEKWQDMERAHRIKVDDFMDWATDFIQHHAHVGAMASVAAEPLTNK